MARMKCGSCQGEYDDVMPDGFRYFHACAPIAVKLKVQRGAATLELAPPAQPGDTVLETIYGARPDHRDENVKVEKGPKGETIVTHKAEGKGAIKLRD